MKISHSARPRNRSRRNSRSLPAGSEIAGTEAPGARASRAGGFASPARGRRANRSAIEVIWHHLGQVGFSRRPTAEIVSARDLQASYDTASQRRGRALDWNYGETTIGIRMTSPPPRRSGGWFEQILSV